MTITRDEFMVEDDGVTMTVKEKDEAALNDPGPGESKKDEGKGTEDNTSEEPTAEEQNDESQDSESKDEAEKKKPAKGYEKRIDALTRQKYELRKELDEMRKEIERFKNPETKKTRDDFFTDAEFDEHRQRTLLQEEIERNNEAIRRQADNERIQRERYADFLNRADEIRKRFSDWDDTMASASFEVTPAIQELCFLEPKVGYYLAKNPDAAERFARAATEQQIQLEAGYILHSARAMQPAEGEKPKKPKEPVRPTPRSTGRETSISTDNESMSDYVERMNQRERKRRGR